MNDGILLRDYRLISRVSFT